MKPGKKNNLYGYLRGSMMPEEETFTGEVAAIRIGLVNASLPFDVLAAVLFGSRAKGGEEPSSDTDLLVVAERICDKRHKRTEEILLIKESLPVSGADILLLTPEEARSNFENHNPLFLDIAEEGVVLFDETGLIRQLMGETRRYIRKRGIRRYRTGWMFPVEQGRPTPLSRVTNEDFSRAMRKDGGRDLEIGKQLTRAAFYDKAVYHFQQASEKAVKGILISMGVFQKTHFVGEILKETVKEKALAEPWAARLLEAGEISEKMEPQVSLSRHPGIQQDKLWLPSEEYGDEEAQEALRNAEAACSIAQDFLTYWFTESS
jgi:HEPN domain-containing protein/predicted nucleotidyltransferase